MKRSIWLAALGCLLVPSLWAQVLDKPAATVRLTKTESVAVSQLRKVVSSLETTQGKPLTLDQRKATLDSLIATVLVVQAADRDKVTLSDAELKAAIDLYAQQIGALANLGRAMTDAELQQYLKSGGVSNDDFQKQIKDRQIMIKYAQVKRKSMFDAVKPVTDADIQDYYDANKTGFFVDDMVTFRHIFINTSQLTSKDDRDKAAKRADDILKELKAGAAFGDLVMKYSEDTTSKYKNGEISGALARANAQQKQYFGQAFFDAVFKLKKGETSGVIQSNLGLHIVQISSKIDAKLLTLDDKIPPQNQQGVRDYIRNIIASQRGNDTLQAALLEIVAELKKQADIKTFDDNLNW